MGKTSELRGCPRKLVNGEQMGYNLHINGVYWGYNFTSHLLNSWDIQVSNEKISGWLGFYKGLYYPVI